MLNTALITDETSLVDMTELRKYLSGKHALVAQGGGQRGIFTAGVLDALLQAQADPFDCFYGTSAGALNLTAFLCRQQGLGRHFILELTTKSEFFSLFKHIRNKQFMDLDWAFDQLNHSEYRLDIEAGKEALAEREAYAAVTHIDNLHDEYLPIFTPDWQPTLKASCAIPSLYRQQITINGKNYIDGGVSAAIPVQEAWRKGARMISIIRTEPIEKEVLNETEQVQSSFFNWAGVEQYVDAIQDKIAHQTASWKQDLNSFLQARISDAQQKQVTAPKPVLNGGRWLFGGGDVYRLCHLLGEQFDSGLMDMLMVHYQTFTMTNDFINTPPSDSFILQIAPEQALQSSPLLSNADELAHDYQMGIRAGERWLRLLERVCLS